MNPPNDSKDELDKILLSLMGSSPDDMDAQIFREDYTYVEGKQSIESLITQAVIAARIDELERLLEERETRIQDGLQSKHSSHIGGVRHIKKRIAQLKGQAS